MISKTIRNINLKNISGVPLSNEEENYTEAAKFLKYIINKLNKYEYTGEIYYGRSKKNIIMCYEEEVEELHISISEIWNVLMRSYNIEGYKVKDVVKKIVGDILKIKIHSITISYSIAEIEL